MSVVICVSTSDGGIVLRWSPAKYAAAMMMLASSQASLWSSSQFAVGACGVKGTGRSIETGSEGVGDAIGRGEDDGVGVGVGFWAVLVGSGVGTG